MMNGKPVPAQVCASLLTPEALRSIETQSIFVPVFKETIVSADLPHVRTANSEMHSTVVKMALKTRPLDATQLRAEKRTSMNDAPWDFQAQTVVETRNDV